VRFDAAAGLPCCWRRGWPAACGDSCARLRYQQALLRLREADIPTRADAEAGAREYIELRARWEPGIAGLAPAPGFRMQDVDTAAYGERRRAGA
jgi:hypothetical protein